MLVSTRPMRLLLAALAACAATWALASIASARPVGVSPVDPSAWTAAAASPMHAGIGDRSVPNPRQVDAVLADLKRQRAAEDAGAPATAGDGEGAALVLSIVAIVIALGAVTLTITRPRGRLQT